MLQEFDQFITAMADECGCIFHHVMKSGSQLIASIKEADREEFYNFQMSEAEFSNTPFRDKFKADIISKIEALRMEYSE